MKPTASRPWRATTSTNTPKKIYRLQTTHAKSLQEKSNSLFLVASITTHSKTMTAYDQ